ncbi:hypothetical protein [Kangiella sp. TOML190]|uniref:hypothetical protein n=1 Tax=Kangiella sp. TOML190 TaxID=2931351 RepID=UPI00203DF0EC|nr:hypothetical protein [Kangiella sp. TOML190]
MQLTVVSGKGDSAPDFFKEGAIWDLKENNSKISSIKLFKDSYVEKSMIKELAILEEGNKKLILSIFFDEAHEAKLEAEKKDLDEILRIKNSLGDHKEFKHVEKISILSIIGLIFLVIFLFSVFKEDDLGLSENTKIRLCKAALAKLNANSAFNYSKIDQSSSGFNIQSDKGYGYSCDINGKSIELDSPNWRSIKTGVLSKSNNCVTFKVKDDVFNMSHTGQVCN